MPYWAVGIVVVVLVVVYYLLSQQGRERRREKVGVDFAKIPDFYANQTYTDVHGEAAVGIDDRGRRVAVARKHSQPRTRVYSFAHIMSAEVVQNDQVIASVTPTTKDAPQAAGGDPTSSTAPITGGFPEGSLYGSTKQSVRDVFSGLPVLKPVLGQLTTAAVRVKFRNGKEIDEVLIRFYDGKAVNVDGVEGQRAMGEAQVLLGSLDMAIKRAGVPPKGPAGPSLPIPKTPVI
jgi:hypothetical protein